MRPRRSGSPEQTQPREIEADSVMSLAEEAPVEQALHPVDENFGRYPFDRFREAAEGRVSAREYAHDLLQHVGVDLG